MKNTFGLEWTPELHEPLTESLDAFSCVEIIPENFFEGRFDEFLELTRQRNLPVSVHGVQLSIGSAEPLKEKHLRDVLEIASRVNAVFYSEHLSLTEAGGIDLDALTPLAWTEDVLDIVCSKIERIQSKISTPFLIENVANRFVLSDRDFSETAFINEILRRTGCGLLLDITNVYTNSKNFNFDPFRWIDEVNTDAVRVVHLAGGILEPDGFIMDSHDSDVPPAAWELYSHFCKKTSGFMTIIERTGNLPKISSLVDELGKAQHITERFCPPLPPFKQGEPQSAYSVLRGL